MCECESVCETERGREKESVPRFFFSFRCLLLFGSYLVNFRLSVCLFGGVRGLESVFGAVQVILCAVQPIS